jgi:hypothetical protein
VVKEIRVTPDQPEPQVQKVIKVTLELLEQKEILVLPEVMAQTVVLELKVILVQLDQQDPLEPRAILVQLELLEQKEALVHKVHKEQQAHKEQPVQQAVMPQ